MRKKTKQILSICGIALGIFLVASPFVISYAQKKDETSRETQKKETRDQDEQTPDAKQEIAKSVVGNILLDTISVKEADWELNKAGYLERHKDNKAATIDMLLKNGDNFVGVTISEHDSVKDADERFNAVREYGGSVDFNVYGDRGEKIIDQNGRLMAIRFRKGNFFVAIFSRDQKTAERFAAYALEAVNSFTPK